MIVRRTKDALERAAEATSEAELRERLEAVERELELAATQPQRQRVWRWDWATEPKDTTWALTLPDLPPPPKATHEIRDGEVELRLETGATFGDVVFTMEDPAGVSWTKTFFSPGIVGKRRQYGVLFPHDFDGAALSAGDYEVTWTQTMFLNIGGVQQGPLARDSFSIDGGNAGATESA